MASRATRAIVLRAVAAGRVTVTSAGFNLDGRLVVGEVRDVLDAAWLEDLIDAELNVDEGPERVVLTSSGEQALSTAKQPEEIR